MLDQLRKSTLFRVLLLVGFGMHYHFMMSCPQWISIPMLAIWGGLFLWTYSVNAYRSSTKKTFAGRQWKTCSMIVPFLGFIFLVGVIGKENITPWKITFALMLGYYLLIISIPAGKSDDYEIAP
jgi:hypothetical protein